MQYLVFFYLDCFDYIVCWEEKFPSVIWVQFDLVVLNSKIFWLLSDESISKFMQAFFGC